MVPDSYTCVVSEPIDVNVTSEPYFEPFTTLDIAFNLSPVNNDNYVIEEYQINSSD